jgi:phospholipid/cholesterol/gamma-HCH transport system substrate-binding protein
VAVFSTLVLWTTLQNTVSGDTHTYTAEFTDVTGLHAGDDVRIAGVKVGRVEALELAGSKAVVEFIVEDDQPIFENTRAIIRYQNLIGQRYMALRQGRGAAKPIPDGGQIPSNRTEPSLDLTALLGGFEPLFDLLEPEELNKLSGNIISVLQGEGPALQDLLEQTASLTTDLAERDEVIGDVITNLTDVTDHLAGRTEGFEKLISRSKVLVNGLSKNADKIIGTMDTLDRTATTMTDLIGDIRPALKRDISKFNQVADLYLDEGKAVEDTIQGLPGFLGGFGRITQYGSFATLYACVVDVEISGVLPGGVVGGVGGKRHTEVCR